MKNAVRAKLAIAATLTTFLLPLEAKADPQGFFRPAACGRNAGVGFANVDKQTNPSLFGKGIILTTILGANTTGVERRAGYEVDILGLKNPNYPGGGPFERAVINFRISDIPQINTNPDNLVARFHLKKGGVVAKTFKELGISQIQKGTWQQAVATSAQFGSNDVVSRLVVYARNSANRPIEAQFGDVDIIHRSQGNIDGRIIMSAGDCDDLDL